VTVLLVSGTGTGVGKTMVTAAVAALARAAGRTVAAVKPAQTGLPAGEPGDLAEVGRLAGLSGADLHELTRYEAPLAPAAAARLEDRPGPDLGVVTDAVRSLASRCDLVLVEGAGGLLVRFDAKGWTLADLAGALAVPVLLVADPGLGTLNQTALSLEVLATRGLTCAGVVLGSWPVSPEQPDLASRSNLEDLEEIVGGRLAGVLPTGAATLGPAAFLTASLAGLAPSLGGHFDAADFRRTHGLTRDA
jgi:dethiobiotin synthetase